MDEPVTGTLQTGMDRRDVLRRGAILGGALVWTVPAVQTLAGPAFAAGSPCIGRVVYSDSRVPPACLQVTFVASDECCDCVTTQTPNFGNIVLLAAVYCTVIGECKIASAGTC